MKIFAFAVKTKLLVSKSKLEANNKTKFWDPS